MTLLIPLGPKKKTKTRVLSLILIYLINLRDLYSTNHALGTPKHFTKINSCHSHSNRSKSRTEDNKYNCSKLKN